VGVKVRVAVGGGVRVTVPDAVLLGVALIVAVIEAVAERLGVADGVAEGVAVLVPVELRVRVAEAVLLGLAVGVRVGVAVKVGPVTVKVWATLQPLALPKELRALTRQTWLPGEVAMAWLTEAAEEVTPSSQT
jgi:hypothetical protein